MAGNAEITLGGYSLSSIVRRVRRTADLSQRELAHHARVGVGTVAGVETGRLNPSIPTLQRILHAASYQLVVVDASGRLVLPLEVWQDVADGAARRFPAHLDTILDPVIGDWWADCFGLTAPPETFRRSRAYRDYLRRLSQWEVRVAKYRYDKRPRAPRGDPWVADPD